MMFRFGRPCLRSRRRMSTHARRQGQRNRTLHSRKDWGCMPLPIQTKQIEWACVAAGGLSSITSIVALEMQYFMIPRGNESLDRPSRPLIFVCVRCTSDIGYPSVLESGERAKTKINRIRKCFGVSTPVPPSHLPRR